MEPKYKDPDWLREQYYDKQRSQNDMADECGCCQCTISIWMERHGIETRPQSEARKLANEKLYGDRKYHNKEWLEEQYIAKQRSRNDIAEECNVYGSTVSHWLRRLGIPTRNYLNEYKDYRDKEWLYHEYWDKEKSMYEIADGVGSNPSTIRRWMKKYDIPIRSKSDALKLARNKEYRRYKDPEWLRQKYWEEGLSITQMAELCDVSNALVRQYMIKHDISRRSLSEANSGEQNGRYGMPVSEETRRLIGEAQKGRTGSECGAWNGGGIYYYGPNWYKQKDKALKRDGYVCQDCGVLCSKNGWKNQVHHKISMRMYMKSVKEMYQFMDGYNLEVFDMLDSDTVIPDVIWKEANRLDNLVTLCATCHQRRHRG